MKKINLDKIYRLRADVEMGKELLANAIEAKSRKRSEKALEKADKEIASIRRMIKVDENRLAEVEAEAEEAKKLVAAGGEIVLAYVWLDDYGRRDSEVKRSLWKSLEEAKAVYMEAKEGNGGYINAWIEVHEAGEFDRIRELKKKIAELEAELKELGGE